MKDAEVNSDWDIYDSHIQRLVSRYNDFLAGKGGYVPLDWHLIKAMIWVETGVLYEQGKPWKTMPMQIGNLGDPGLHDLLINPNRKLVVLPELWPRFTKAKITSDPYINIEAGTSLLFLRMAHFGLVEVHESPTRIKGKRASKPSSSHSVIGGRSNQHHRPRPKKVVAIIGWRPFTPPMVYMRYNQGDECYARKLSYCLELMHLIEENGRPKLTQ